MTSLGLWLVGLGGRSAGLLLSALSLVVVARALGPEGRGQYFVLVTFVLVLAVVADLGISQAAVVFGGRRDLRTAEVHRVLLLLAGALGVAIPLAALPVLLVAAERLLPGLPRSWWLGGLLLTPLAVYASFWTGLMIGSRRIVAVNAVLVGTGALSVAANLLFVATTGDPAVAVLVYAGVLAVQAAVMFVLALRTPPAEALGERSPGLLPRMLLFGLRGYPNALSMLVWTRAAVFVLNALHGSAAVGIYSVAQQLAEKAVAPVQAVQDLMYRRMAQLPSREAARLVNLYVRVALAGAVPMLAAAILAAPIVVALLFSTEFADATLPLRLLLVGAAVQTVPLLLSPYFLAHLERPGLLSALAWANAGLNLLLLLLLARAGAPGAALAMLATQVAGTAVVFALYLRLSRSAAGETLLVRRDDLSLVRRQALGLIDR